MHASLLLLLTLTGLLAGFIDSIVGGGGLLTLPVLLTTGLPPHTVLGTNKLAASAAVLSSTLVYLRKNLYNIRLWIFIIVAAMLGAVVGTVVIHFLTADWLNKLIPFLLIVLVIYMAIPKNLRQKGQAFTYKPPRVKGGIIGLILGFYDGFFGPGTGSFWATALLYFFKLDLLQATAIARLMNFASNVVAAVIFALYGSINYLAAVALMIGYVSGSYIGAHSAIRYGQRLIKPLFLVVVTIIAGKLIYQNF